MVGAIQPYEMLESVLHKDSVTITRSNFWSRLLTVLRAMADARFITFDLEMSGIAANRSESAKNTPRRALPDLQEYYRETKRAAEKYQVVQFGMTCVTEDRETGTYTAKVFNFNVNPLVHDSWILGNLQRDVTLSTDAIKFLIKHGFNMGAMFEGPTFLSQTEYDTACRIFNERRIGEQEPMCDPVFGLDDKDEEFYHTSRAKIQEWINDKDLQKPGFLNIDSTSAHKRNSPQFRLVRTLVENHFPGYIARNKQKGTFIQVEEYSVSEALCHLKRKEQLFRDSVYSQKGRSIIYEALTGNAQLTEIPPNWLATDKDGIKVEPDSDFRVIISELETLQRRLNTKESLLVGHNLFTDLVYLTQTFEGWLPEDLISFKSFVQDKFPRIIDTKFIATEQTPLSGSSNESSLHALWKRYEEQSTRHEIILHRDSSGYQESQIHESGYDSWITAQLFVKLVDNLTSTKFVSPAITTNKPFTLSLDTVSFVKKSKLISPEFLDLTEDRIDDSNVAKTSSAQFPISKRVSPNHAQQTWLASGSTFDSISCAALGSHSILDAPVSQLSIMDQGIDNDMQRYHVAVLVSLNDLEANGSLLTHHATNSEETFVDCIDAEESRISITYPAFEPVPSRFGHEYSSVMYKTQDAETTRWIPDEGDVFWQKYENKLRTYSAIPTVCDLADHRWCSSQ